MPGVGSIFKNVGRALFTGRAEIGTKVGEVANHLWPLVGSSGIGTIGGAFLKKALPYYAIGAGIDYIANETNFGSEMSGAQRFGASVLSFGFKANAARHMIRGAAGSALYGAGAITGNPLRFQGAYSWVEGKLNQVALGALKLPFKAAWGIAKAPFKMAVGLPYAAVAGARVGMNLVGSSLFGRYGLAGAVGRGLAFHGPGRLMEKIGLKSAGAAWRGVGSRVGEGMALFFEGRPSIGSQLEPSLGGFLRQRPFSWFPGAKALGGTRAMQHTAPTMYGFAALGAAASVMSSYQRYKSNSSGGMVSSSIAPNPGNFGGGISVMRRGPAANYGPALTLMLHQNHSRRM